MTRREPGPGDRWLKWAYWLVFVAMAIGAGRALLKLARAWGWS